MSVKKKCFSMSKGFLLIKNGMFSKKISYVKNWINPNRSLGKKLRACPPTCPPTHLKLLTIKLKNIINEHYVFYFKGKYQFLVSISNVNRLSSLMPKRSEMGVAK